MRREREMVAPRRVLHGASMLLGTMLAVVMLLSAHPMSRVYGHSRVAPLVAVLSLVILLSGENAMPMALLQQLLEHRVRSPQFIPNE